MIKLIVNPIFQDGMVLQREKKIKIWGLSYPGHRIRVAIGSQESLTQTDTQGNWTIALSAMQAAENLCVKIIDEDSSEIITLKNVAIGEVWIAGGQSNMEYPVKYDVDRCIEILRPENPRIRFYDVPHCAYEGDCSETLQRGVWRMANKEELDYFSAVGYYFARELENNLNVPIGIIGCNWGGTTAMTWVPDERLKKHEKLSKYWEEYRKEAESIDENEYEERYLKNKQFSQKLDYEFLDHVLYGMSWLEQREFQKKCMEIPNVPLGPKSVNAPGNLFASMVKTIVGYSVRGVIWYQGEGDWMRADDYNYLFQEVIYSWREAWNEELPWLCVQIAPFYRWIGETGEFYPILRRQQEKVCRSVPNVWMAVTTDCGMKWDIHPKRKQPVGIRLALLARGKVYGHDILCEAPECVKAVRKDKCVELYFSNFGEGLWMSDSKQEGFYGWNQEQKIQLEVKHCEGSMVSLCIPEETKEIKQISFMEEPYGECVIYNSENNPLKPFRVAVENSPDII